MLSEMLYQVASVHQVVNNTTPYGSVVKLVVPKYDSVDCRKNQFRNSTKKLSNGYVKPLPNTFKIYIETNIDINTKDLIYLNGFYYDILHVYKVNAYGTYNHTQVIAKKVAGQVELVQYLLHEDFDFVLTEEGNDLIILE